MAISASEVKRLRDETGAGMMDCKRALEEAQGDRQKAREILRQKGQAVSAKRAAKAANEGLISAYVHFNNKVAVLVEMNCETDFVARTDAFKELGREIAMQIAMTNPPYLDKEDVPAEVLAQERAIQLARLQEEEKAQGQPKPPQVRERIVEGRLSKFYEEVCLLEQPYIRDDKKKVRDLLAEAVGRLGENLRVGRFVRLAVGEQARAE